MPALLTPGEDDLDDLDGETGAEASARAATSRAPGPVILAANHRSCLDPVVMGITAGMSVYLMGRKG